MATDTGKNLLSPGKLPGRNLRFLTFFVNTIKAVATHADLLRASVASASNDHRLGANEAPPAIVSIYVGSEMTSILDKIENGLIADEDGVKKLLNLLSKLPNLHLDNTDRNRTSPFAFTGNKFEIRMVGSSQNCAKPMTVMNTIVGAQLNEFYRETQQLIQSGMDQDSALLSVIQRYIRESRNILFEGDGYSEAWKNEAAERGLSNLPNTPEALEAYIRPSSLSLFKNSGVFSEIELHAHYEVMVEQYILSMQIESRTLGEMCVNWILPAALQYQTSLAENILKLQQIGMDAGVYEAQRDILMRMSDNINTIKNHVEAMRVARKNANNQEHAIDRAKAYCYDVKPHMETIRLHADRLEYLVDDKLWPLVKYRELMFVR